MPNLPDQKPVENVDLKRYMGDWHVIAAIPTAFDGTFNPVEHYSWNEREKRVDIDYSYNADSLDGRTKHVTQKGFIDNPQNSEWKIQIWWPLKFSYQIVDLAADYSDVIVGVPSRKYAWIMARDTQMSDARLETQIEKLKTLGYDTSKLKMSINPPKSAASAFRSMPH